MFKKRVLAVVQGIPKGETLSYRDVAERAGYPHAYRAVGSVLKSNRNPMIPCHRVIRSDGSAGEYNRGRTLKIKKLKDEGAL